MPKHNVHFGSTECLHGHAQRGTKTAIRQSEFPWREIRKLPKPDEHTELYEYQLPEMYREKLM